VRGGFARERKEPEAIGAIIGRWINARRFSEELNQEGIHRRWGEVVGEEVSAQTRVVKCTGGILTVEVASAPLLLELSAYYRREILESIRAQPEFRGIQDLRFRAGSIVKEGKRD
jgi:hypothetical protein